MANRRPKISYETCWFCEGSGEATDVKTKEVVTCDICEGTGEVITDQGEEG